jgi:hypothetical protein
LRSPIKILDGLGFKLSTNFARCLGCPGEYILYNIKEGSPGTRRVCPIKELLLLFIQVYCPYATLCYERPTPHL